MASIAARTTHRSSFSRAMNTVLLSGVTFTSTESKKYKMDIRYLKGRRYTAQELGTVLYWNTDTPKWGHFLREYWYLVNHPTCLKQNEKAKLEPLAAQQVVCWRRRIVYRQGFDRSHVHMNLRNQTLLQSEFTKMCEPHVVENCLRPIDSEEHTDVFVRNVWDNFQHLVASRTARIRLK